MVNGQAVRFALQAWLMARIYGGYKRIQLARRLGLGGGDGTLARQHRRSADAAYDLATRLEGLPIKVCQFLGSRADILPDEYVQVLSQLQDKVPSRPASVMPTAFDWSPHVPPASGHVVVPEDRCHRILQAAGLAAAAARLVPDEAAARRAATELGFPVVLKGISPSVTHRAAAGLLAVDLRSEAEVADAARRLLGRARELGVVLDGLYVQKMYRGGTELLLAAFRDPMFGVMVSCGSGGGLTELIDDVVTARAPVDPAYAATLLERLRIRRHATDQQGPLPVAPAAAFLARFSELALTAPWPRFVFEVNPVKWTRDAAVAVDGLLLID